MFRFGIAILAIIGLVSLLSGAASWAIGGLFVLLLPLLFIAKIMFILLIFGMFKGFAHRRGYAHHGPWGWRPRRQVDRSGEPSEQERFDEWHRLQHARDEVDGWVNPTVDDL